jgi:hypothetical protein
MLRARSRLTRQHNNSTAASHAGKLAIRLGGGIFSSPMSLVRNRGGLGLLSAAREPAVPGDPSHVARVTPAAVFFVAAVRDRGYGGVRPGTAWPAGSRHAHGVPSLPLRASWRPCPPSPGWKPGDSGRNTSPVATHVGVALPPGSPSGVRARFGVAGGLAACSRCPVASAPGFLAACGHRAYCRDIIQDRAARRTFHACRQPRRSD